MKLRTRLAALAIGATAAVTPLANMPAANAAPASTEATSAPAEPGGEEYWYYWGIYWTGPECHVIGFQGFAAGIWRSNWRCYELGDSNYYELYVDPYIIA
jgi:hypothetical protein